MNIWLAIAIGGAAGAVSRFWLSSTISHWLGREFPWGTMTVNIIGSFFIGLLTVLLLERMDVTAEWRMAILVGFLGAFTTFSTFSLETFYLLEQLDFVKASLNIVGSVVVCVLATIGGVMIARQIG